MLSTHRSRLLRLWSHQEAVSPSGEGLGEGKPARNWVQRWCCCAMGGSLLCPAPGAGTTWVCRRDEAQSRPRVASPSPGCACVQAQVAPGLRWPGGGVSAGLHLSAVAFGVPGCLSRAPLPLSAHLVVFLVPPCRAPHRRSEKSWRMESSTASRSAKCSSITQPTKGSAGWG